MGRQPRINTTPFKHSQRMLLKAGYELLRKQRLDEHFLFGLWNKCRSSFRRRITEWLQGRLD